MGIENLTTYLIAITLLTLTPGVDTMLIIRNSARGGWQDGFMSSFGICCGLLIQASVSALGISIILMQAAWAFNMLKWAGACYLVWLGISNWKQVLVKRKRAVTEDDQPPHKYGFNSVRSFREGFFTNILNPKTIVFYMAFLPQFINPSYSALAQSLILAGFHFIIAMIWQCFLALSITKAKKIIEQPEFNRIFSGITGSVMIFLGLRLAMD